MRYSSISTLLIWVSLVCGMRAQSPKPKQTTAHDAPLWTIDLRQFGYERWLRKNTRPFPVGVDFTDADHIAVAWTMPDTPHEAKEKALAPAPAHLNVVILDAKTGQKQNKAEWPTVARYFSTPLLFGIPDRKLLTCSENHLRLLSPSLRIVQEMQLPSHASCLNVHFQPSPSRRTVLVSIPSELGRNEELLDVETLSVLSGWNQERTSKEASSNGIISISDHWAVGYCGGPSELCLRRSGEDWQPFHPTGFDIHMIGHQRIPSSFVNDSTLVVTRQVAAVATVDGTILFEIVPPHDHVLLSPVTSAGGSHFAMIENRFRGLKSQPLDMSPFVANDRALIYSIKERRCVVSIKLKGTSPWSPWDVHDNYLALSPDGTSLAVVSDGVLKTYTLPGDSVGIGKCR